jgi:hypothetical protein
MRRDQRMLPKWPLFTLRSTEGCSTAQAGSGCCGRAAAALNINVFSCTNTDLWLRTA